MGKPGPSAAPWSRMILPPDVDESGGLTNPAGLVFGPDGTLYVSSNTTHEVLRYDGQTGAFRGALVTDDPPPLRMKAAA